MGHPSLFFRAYFQHGYEAVAWTASPKRSPGFQAGALMVADSCVFSFLLACA
jgi:hypothetical protein